MLGWIITGNPDGAKAQLVNEASGAAIASKPILKQVFEKELEAELEGIIDEASRAKKAKEDVATHAEAAMAADKQLPSSPSPLGGRL